MMDELKAQALQYVKLGGRLMVGPDGRLYEQFRQPEAVHSLVEVHGEIVLSLEF